MHAGVIRDEERTRIKRERQEDFDMQAALREEFLKGQTVRDTSAEGDHRTALEPEKK
jgi:protein PET117